MEELKERRELVKSLLMLEIDACNHDDCAVRLGTIMVLDCWSIGMRKDSLLVKLEGYSSDNLPIKFDT